MQSLVSRPRNPELGHFAALPRSRRPIRACCAMVPYRRRIADAPHPSGPGVSSTAGAGSFELGPAQVGSSGQGGGEEPLEAFRRSTCVVGGSCRDVVQQPVDQ